MALEKVTAGDTWEPIAEAHNVVLDVHRRVQRLVSEFRTGRRRGALAPNVVMVKNMTGDDRARYDVVGLDAGNIVVSPSTDLTAFQNGPILQAISPSSARDQTPSRHATTERIAIVLEPIPSTKYGLACTGGVVPVYIYMAPVTAYYACARYWGGVGGGEYNAEHSHAGHMTILWQPTVTGGFSWEWCVVKLGNWVSPRWLGVADGTLGSSFTATLAAPISGMIPGGSHTVQNPLNLSGSQYDLVIVQWHPGVQTVPTYGPYWVAEAVEQ